MRTSRSWVDSASAGEKWVSCWNRSASRAAPFGGRGLDFRSRSLLRIRAGLAATTLQSIFARAENTCCWFVDSLTRLAMAQREIGLARRNPHGESLHAFVFTMLAGCSRAGGSFGSARSPFLHGMMEGMTKTIAGDAVRALLDGHVMLDRRLAARPLSAISVLDIISRIMMPRDLGPSTSPDQCGGPLSLGYRRPPRMSDWAYQKGSDPELDHAIALIRRCGSS